MLLLLTFDCWQWICVATTLTTTNIYNKYFTIKTQRTRTTLEYFDKESSTYGTLNYKWQWTSGGVEEWRGEAQEAEEVWLYMETKEHAQKSYQDFINISEDISRTMCCIISMRLNWQNTPLRVIVTCWGHPPPQRTLIYS